MNLGLNQKFKELNDRYFDGFLDEPRFHWNPRLRSSAGRFIPGRRGRKYGIITYEAVPAVIEIASYLLKHDDSDRLITDTLGHEMIHYWLWLRRRPYGHTDEFYAKMKEMGVSRYNTVPMTRPYKWVYLCQACQKTFPTRKKLSRPLACADCCKRHSGGRFDARFVLKFSGEMPKEISQKVSKESATELSLFVGPVSPIT